MAKKTFDKTEDASPLYYKLSRILRERISNGEYPPGAKIPTEPKLCEEFGISRVTVRQAVEILENRGYVERQQGRGTFVRKWGTSGFGWRFSGVRDLLYLTEDTWLELISKRKIKASKRIADDLDVPQGQPVYVFKGIKHMINDKSRALYRAYTSESIGREISIKPIKSQLLYLQVEKISREPIKSVKQSIYATLAGGKNAEELGVQPGSPLLVVNRIFRSETERPLLLTFNHYPGESTQSVSILERL